MLPMFPREFLNPSATKVGYVFFSGLSHCNAVCDQELSVIVSITAESRCETSILSHEQKSGPVRQFVVADIHDKRGTVIRDGDVLGTNKWTVPLRQVISLTIKYLYSRIAPINYENAAGTVERNPVG